jgi:hypothetical protein
VVQQQSWKIQRGDARLTIAVTPKPEKEGNATIGRVGAMIGALPPMVRVRLLVRTDALSDAGKIALHVEAG